MIDRLNYPQDNNDKVEVTTRNLQDLRPGIPSFSDEGYVQSSLTHGWHVIVKDPSIKDSGQFLDHAFLVNQHTGQQVQVMFKLNEPKKRRFIKIEPDYDKIDQQLVGLFYTCDTPGYQLNWVCVDDALNPDNTSEYYTNIDGVMVKVDMLADPRFFFLWSQELPVGNERPETKIVVERLEMFREMLAAKTA